MKKGQIILISIWAMLICILFGVFIGRNFPGKYIQLEQDKASPAAQTISAEILPVEETVSSNDGKIDLNTATLTQLMDLPGIGEVLAGRILDYRNTEGPFTSIEDLINVEGIGVKKLEQITPFVRIGG